MTKLSKKAEKHHYITNLEEMKNHTELYRQPHLRSFFSNSFEQVMRESQ